MASTRARSGRWVPTAAAPKAGGVLVEVGLERLWAAEVHDVAELGVAGDRLHASACAAPGELIPRHGSQARSLVLGVRRGRLSAGLLDAVLGAHRLPRIVGKAMRRSDALAGVRACLSWA